VAVGAGRSGAELVREYKIRRIDGSGTDQLERICNDLARDGWRLVSTAAAATGPIDVFVWLFFEREKPD
jgi:hypothetical protein